MLEEERVRDVRAKPFLSEGHGSSSITPSRELRRARQQAIYRRLWSEPVSQTSVGPNRASA